MWSVRAFSGQTHAARYKEAGDTIMTGVNQLGCNIIQWAKGQNRKKEFAKSGFCIHMNDE